MSGGATELLLLPVSLLLLLTKTEGLASRDAAAAWWWDTTARDDDPSTRCSPVDIASWEDNIFWCWMQLLLLLLLVSVLVCCEWQPEIIRSYGVCSQVQFSPWIMIQLGTAVRSSSSFSQPVKKRPPEHAA
jgi:hypothetical protein